MSFEQDTAEYYAWLMPIEWAEFEKELLEIVSIKNILSVLN